MNRSKYRCCPWFQENSLLCVILRYAVYIQDGSKLAQATQQDMVHYRQSSIFTVLISQVFSTYLDMWCEYSAPLYCGSMYTIRPSTLRYCKPISVLALYGIAVYHCHLKLSLVKKVVLLIIRFNFLNLTKSFETPQPSLL